MVPAASPRCACARGRSSLTPRRVRHQGHMDRRLAHAFTRRRPHFLDEPPDGARREYRAHPRVTSTWCCSHRRRAGAEPARAPVDHRCRGRLPRAPGEAHAAGADRVHALDDDETPRRSIPAERGERERARGAREITSGNVGDPQRHLARGARMKHGRRHRAPALTSSSTGSMTAAICSGRDLRDYRGGEAFNFSRLGTFLERRHRAHAYAGPHPLGRLRSRGPADVPHQKAALLRHIGRRERCRGASQVESPRLATIVP